MESIIRVKRQRHEEPKDSLVLNCKRRKIDEAVNATSEVSAVLKFAGTVEAEEEDVLKHIKNFKQHNKPGLESYYKTHIIDIVSKLRLENKDTLKNNRYKVVNCFRSSSQKDENVEDKPSKEYTIYDIETDPDDLPNYFCDSAVSREPKYVYDLYYTNSDDLGGLEEYVSIYPWNDELVHGSTEDNKNGFDSEEDSDDSNVENNWRNDYPDEDNEREDITDEDLLRAVKNCDLDDDLSSDSEDERFVYSIDDEDCFYEKDLDQKDVQKYGEMYARFKARNKSSDGEKNDLYYGEIDDDEEEDGECHSD